MNAVRERDCLIELFDQVRSQRPAVYMADEGQKWLCAIGDCISALPTQSQRWAATVLVAGDLQASMPGLPLGNAYLSIQEAVLKASGKVARY